MEVEPHTTTGASVEQSETGWRLQIPAGGSSTYRLAQLDDYTARRRSGFPWAAAATLSLRARVSSNSIPGTWGFGLWNDPFSAFIGLGGMKRPLPVLPNAAWFFHASSENYLSFRDDKPANGLLAATFHSPVIPSMFLIPSLVFAPLLLFKPSARWLRTRFSRIIIEDGCPVDIDVTRWHDYLLRREMEAVKFEINGQSIFTTTVAPLGPLGLVIWVDNQYAAFMPSGQIRAGVVENQVPAWMEIDNLTVQTQN